MVHRKKYPSDTVALIIWVIGLRAMLTRICHRACAYSNASLSLSRCGRPAIALVARRSQQHAANLSSPPIFRKVPADEKDKRLRAAFAKVNRRSKPSDVHVPRSSWAEKVQNFIQSDLGSALSAYKDSSKPKTIDEYDLRCLTRTCLSLTKGGRGSLTPFDRRDIISLTHEIVKDITTGACKPSPALNSNILYIYRDVGAHDDGLRFFDWLENNDDTYLLHNVYAAAIQLQFGKGLSLEVIEDTYARALTRFPGAFLSYHLSYDSVLPDRRAEVHLPSFPHSLCRARVVALIKHGAIHEAYQFLDVYLRLYPHFVMTEAIHAVIDARPLTEALVLVSMHWNMGKSARNNHYLKVLNNLVYKTSLPGEYNTVPYVRAMTTLMCHCVASNGNVHASISNAYIDGLTSLARLLAKCGGTPEERQSLVNLILASIERLIESFARMGNQPSVKALNAIIGNIAGHDMRGKALDLAQAYFTKLGLPFTEKTHRHLIRAGGIHSNFEVIEVAWKNLVALKGSKSPLGALDFIPLFIATTRAGNRAFAVEEFALHQDSLSPEDKQAIEEVQETTKLAEQADKPTEKEFEPLNQEVYHSISAALAEMSVLENLCAQYPNNDEASRSNLSIPKIPPPVELAIDEASMQKIYDELTTIPASNEETISTSHDSKTSADLSNPSTSQGVDSIPREVEKSSPNSQETENATPSDGQLAQLRYENWKAMTFLMHLADAHESAPKPEDPRVQNLTFGEEDMRILRAFTITPQESSALEQSSSSPSRVERAYEEIRRLRAKNVPQQVGRPEFPSSDA